MNVCGQRHSTALQIDEGFGEKSIGALMVGVIVIITCGVDIAGREVLENGFEVPKNGLAIVGSGAAVQVGVVVDPSQATIRIRLRLASRGSYDGRR